MDYDGNLRSFSYFQRQGLNVNDFQIIQTIYKTIPVSWKRNMKMNNNDTSQDGEEISFIAGERIISIIDIVSKKIYANLLKRNSATPDVF